MRVFMKIFRGLLITVVGLSLVIFLFMQQKSFGKHPSGQRLRRIQQSPQYHNGSFVNVEPTPAIAEGASYWRMLRDFFFSRIPDREPTDTLPVVHTDLKALAQQQGAPTLVWFGHSSYMIRFNGVTILVDPVFSERASPVQYAGSRRYPGTEQYTADDLPDADVVLITHDHYDHLDYGTIKKLKDRVKQWYMPLGVGAHLEYWGIAPEKIHELDWWETIALPGSLTLTATPARHFSGRGFRRNQTLWTSYVLQSPQHKLFVGGDSGYDGSFKKIGERFGPFDLAILECGQYNWQWPYIHMMPEQTVQASRDLQARVLMPVHWAKFSLSLHAWYEPIRRATAEATRLQVPVTTPRIGEPVVLGQALPNSPWWPAL